MVRVNMCTLLEIIVSIDPFLRRIIMGDEKWILYANMKRNKQSLSPNDYKLQKSGQTITFDFYCEQLDYLNDNLFKKHNYSSTR